MRGSPSARNFLALEGVCTATAFNENGDAECISYAEKAATNPNAHVSGTKA
eukprot:gene30711-37968_t